MADRLVQTAVDMGLAQHVARVAIDKDVGARRALAMWNEGQTPSLLRGLAGIGTFYLRCLTRAVSRS